jgi:hypothetical protein
LIANLSREIELRSLPASIAERGERLKKHVRELFVLMEIP